MVESASLAHSFTYAAALSRESHESHEDNPLHALSQSISFGRFMTEPLEWGKWSTFSHRKYVEEAEKYSKPGSVAQKKAFFEARYKKIAAAKKAAADEFSEKQASNDTTTSPNGSETKPVQTEDVKEQNSEAGFLSDVNSPGLKVEKDNEPERKSVQMDDSFSAEEAAVENFTRVGSLNKSRGMNDDGKALNVLVADGIEKNDDYVKVLSLKKNGSISEKNSDLELLNLNGSVGKKDEDGELLKKNASIGNKDESRKSISKNSLARRMSENISAPLKTPDVAAEHPLSRKRSERIAHDSVMNDLKPVRPRFSFLPIGCLLMRTKVQDHGMTRKKEKPEKKLNKAFWCLCFRPQVLEKTETPKKQMKRFQANTQSQKLSN